MKIEWPNQNAHMLFGSTVMLATTMYAPHYWWVGLLGVMGFAVVHELDDVFGPTKQDKLGALVDVGFFGIGGLVSTFVLHLTKKF